MPVDVYVTLTEMTCGECGTHFAIDEALRAECQRTGQAWRCPNGHSRVYIESTEEKLQKARDALARERAKSAQLDASLTATRGVVTRQRNQLTRVTNGVCPCCNRSFQNLQRHMATKHPGHQASA